jgi:hypothetical protein
MKKSVFYFLEFSLILVKYYDCQANSNQTYQHPPPHYPENQTPYLPQYQGSGQHGQIPIFTIPFAFLYELYLMATTS